MAVSTQPLADKAGQDVLDRGGNAIDAAVAVGYALAVLHPQAGNVGGGGFAVIHTADGGDYALDFREMAPGAATRDMYLDIQISAWHRTLLHRAPSASKSTLRKVPSDRRR